MKKKLILFKQEDRDEERIQCANAKKKRKIEAGTLAKEKYLICNANKLIIKSSREENELKCGNEFEPESCQRE